MKNNLKTPCDECPFRKNSFAGWLGNLTPEQTYEYVLNEADFACHKTRHKKLNEMSRCKGAQLFLLNHCKIPKFNMELKLALEQTEKEKHDLNLILGFDFLSHHNKYNKKTKQK